MKPEILPFLLLALLLTGCGVTGQVTGTIRDKDGHAVANANVTFWHHTMVPFTLPARIATATSDQQGKFEVLLAKSANFVTASTRTLTSERFLNSFDTNPLQLVATMRPPPDYSHINKDRRQPTGGKIHVKIIGLVQRPGDYFLEKDTSAWTAIEAAGGLIPEILNLRIELHRVSPDGHTNTIYPLEWEERNQAKVPPLLGDADRIEVKPFELDPILN